MFSFDDETTPVESTEEGVTETASDEPTVEEEAGAEVAA